MASEQQSTDPGGGEALYDPPADATETERLRDERNFWKHLFEDLTRRFPEPVLVVDDDGRVSHWNDEQAAIQNTPAEAVLGEVAHDVIGTDDVTETLAEETSVGMAEIAEATDEQAVSAEEVTTMLNDALDSLEDVVAEIGDLAAENDRQATAARGVHERIHAVEADLEDSLDA